MRRLIYLVVFGALFQGWMVAQTPSSDAEAVKKTLAAMWEAIEEGDLQKYASYLHADFTAFGESDPYLLIGKEKEVRSIGSYLKRASNVHTEMHQPIVRVSGNVAWIVYYWTDEGIIDGKRSTSRGKSTRIFLKENGRWLCAHGHYTAVD